MTHTDSGWPSLRYTGHVVRVLHRLPTCTAADLAALCGLPPVTLSGSLSALAEADWAVRLILAGDAVSNARRDGMAPPLLPLPASPRR